MELRRASLYPQNFINPQTTVSHGYRASFASRNVETQIEPCLRQIGREECNCGACENDRALMEAYEVTPNFVLKEAFNAIGNTSKRIRNSSMSLMLGGITGGLFVLNQLFTFFTNYSGDVNSDQGKADAVDGSSTLADISKYIYLLTVIAVPFLAFGYKILQIKKNGRLSVNQAALRANADELKEIRRERGFKSFEFYGSQQVLEEQYPGSTGSTENLVLAEKDNELRKTQAEWWIEAYEKSIQKICFTASTNGECNENSSEGSERTQQRIQRLENSQDKYCEQKVTAEETGFALKSFVETGIQIHKLNQRADVCVERAIVLALDKQRLQVLQGKVKAPST